MLINFGSGKGEEIKLQQEAFDQMCVLVCRLRPLFFIIIIIFFSSNSRNHIEKC